MRLLPDELLQTAAFILVGIMGGTVRYLRQIQLNSIKLFIIQMLIIISADGFLGMLTYFLGMGLEMKPPMIGFMYGMAGLMGDEAIRIYTDQFKRGL